MDYDNIQKRLSNWTELVDGFAKLSEEDLAALLEHETKFDKRPSFLHKIHQRMNELRRRREIKELKKIGRPKP